MLLNIWKYENDTFNRVRVIDNATSIIWVKRYYTAGEFELYIAASAELLELFQGDIFITRDDTTTAMYVESVKLTTNAETGDYLTIKGHSAEIMLNWRVIQRAVYSSDSTTAERVVRDLLTTWIIQPSEIIISDDYIPFLTLGDARGYTDTLSAQYTGKGLLDVISGICNTFNYGIEFAWNGSGFTVNLYKGVDRSLDQSENTFVIFSPEFENLGKTEFSTDTSRFANSAIIGGEGEGTARVFAYVYPEGITGFYRRTIFVDARQSSSDTESGELTPNQYRKQLQAAGQDAVAERKITRSFSGEILNYNAYKYGVDYGLGDKVSIVNEYGVRGNATITEITEVEDGTGYKLVPTLSGWELEV